MFEVKKFNKKYSLLTSFVRDKKQMKKYLEDKILLEFYMQNNQLLEKFINNLKILYNNEKVENIVMAIINNKHFEKLKIVSYNLNQYINWYKYYNRSLESITAIDWSIIENYNQKFNGFEIERKVLDLCFINNYKETIYINDHDIKNIFTHTNSLNTKRKLFSLLKNNRLDFFAFIINKLNKYNINIENMDNIFNEELNDSIYNKEIKENLSEQDFIYLIIYFFKTATPKEQKIIEELIDSKNYELISDILHLKTKYSFAKYIKENDIEKDIFSLNTMGSHEISIIISDILSPKVKLDIKYFENLRYSVGEDIYNKFYENHKELLDLLTNILYDNFSKLTKEEQKSIYNYVKSLSQDKKSLLIDEITLINLELRKLYKEQYLDVICKSNNIIEKAAQKEIKDTTFKKHNVRVYELKDEEPFTFLITVMHNKARDGFLNMYGRPAHKLTINDPANFCRDLSGGSEIISTSIINEKFIDTFVGPYADVMYVFSDIKEEDILSICHQDAAFPPKIEENIDLFSKETPMGIEELMRETRRNGAYNEIAIKRKRTDKKRIMPTAILCYDKINDISIKHAEYFNIPIIVINTKTYKNLKNYTVEKDKRYSI